MQFSFLFFIGFLCSTCWANLDREWWKHTIIYEIIPYTFKDSDGDGIGDFKGVTSKLDYLKNLGIETIYFTPMHKSSGQDMGYDVIDFYSVDPILGTMDDFDELIREMKKRDMKLLVDFVINHSSNKNEWFLKSIDKIEPYTNYYIWKDPKGYEEDTGKPIPPNNWVSVFNLIAGSYEPGTAWTWNEKRKQFYLHQFLEHQVDFNLWNEKVVEELKKIIKFWLDKGIGGFRIDAANYCFEDKYFRDGSFWSRQIDQEETYPFFHGLRIFLDQYNEKHGGFEKIFVVEAHTGHNHILKFYGTEDYPVVHYPFTFDLVYIYGDQNAIQFNYTIQTWLGKLPKHSVSAWVTEDHDGDRVGSRIRPEYKNILTITSMLLPGAVHCYYGQEIAMQNGYINSEQVKDISAGGLRDPARLIMQWDDNVNAGFSTNTQSTYLPANTDYFSRNLKRQMQQEISDFQIFKVLSKLRSTDVFKYGDIKTYVPSEYIFIFSRSHKNQIYYIVINLSSISQTVKLNKAIHDFPEQVSIATASINAGYKKGFKIENELANELVMRPMSCIVLHGEVQDS